jgi:predicted nucleotidyltransferase
MGLYLFGSQARGDAHPGSDVDLGILFEYKYHAPLRLARSSAVAKPHDYELISYRMPSRVP